MFIFWKQWYNSKPKGYWNLNEWIHILEVYILHCKKVEETQWNNNFLHSQKHVQYCISGFVYGMLLQEVL